MKCKGIRLAALLLLSPSICTLGCGEEPIDEGPSIEQASNVPTTGASDTPAVSGAPAGVAQPSTDNQGAPASDTVPSSGSIPLSTPTPAGDTAAPSSDAQPSGGLEVAPGAEDPTESIMVLSGGLPCDVKEILSNGCSQCHSASPAFGAPMSLETYEDLMAPAVTDPTRTVYDLVLERTQDATRPMPPAPYERLDTPQLQALSTWQDAGFPTSSDSCEVNSIEPLPPQELPTGERCNIDLTLTANDNGGGYHVPMVDDHYECFYFDAPDTSVFQVTGWGPIIDDERTLHHWLLYSTQRDVAPGTHESCTGIHPEDTLIGGWAPGGTIYVMPDNVGLEVPIGSNTRFIVELHYNNVARHADSVDQSGAHLCATDVPQENTAATHWLGTENILLLPGETEATTTCTPKGEVTIIGVTPHMHELGVHSSVIINRADGTKETLLDEPFNFNSQIGYQTPAKLMPGDTLSATCKWNNTTGAVVGFGEGTSDEMCYLFTTAYPIGPMDTGGDLLGVGAIGGINKCMH